MAAFLDSSRYSLHRRGMRAPHLTALQCSEPCKQEHVPFAHADTIRKQWLTKKRGLSSHAENAVATKSWRSQSDIQATSSSPLVGTICSKNKMSLHFTPLELK